MIFETEVLTPPVPSLWYTQHICICLKTVITLVNNGYLKMMSGISDYNFGSAAYENVARHKTNPPSPPEFDPQKYMTLSLNSSF